MAGDTDSIYFRPRFSHYSQLLSNSNVGDDLFAQILTCANGVARNLQVNSMIGGQTSNFLSMAFEELLFPSIFTGKKKYFGVIYEPDKIQPRRTVDVTARGQALIKGIDFIKGQYPDLVKETGMGLLNELLNHFNGKMWALGPLFSEDPQLAVSQLADLFAD